MNLITVIGFHAGDAPMAEKLCDWIYHLSGQRGHCLLVCANDVHEEMQIKTKIAAEVAFESASMVVAEIDRLTKPERVNHLFRFAALQVMNRYRTPWIYLDPDCVPLIDEWRETLAEAYENQPMRYMGPHILHKSKPLLSRVAIYPMDAYKDLAPYCGANIPFEFPSADDILPRSSKSRLIQHGRYVHDLETPCIRPDAVLFHSDKTGMLIDYRMQNPQVENIQVPDPSGGLVATVQAPKPFTLKVTRKPRVEKV